MRICEETAREAAGTGQAHRVLFRYRTQLNRTQAEQVQIPLSSCPQSLTQRLEK